MKKAPDFSGVSLCLHQFCPTNGQATGHQKYEKLEHYFFLSSIRLVLSRRSYNSFSLFSRYSFGSSFSLFLIFFFILDKCFLSFIYCEKMTPNNLYTFPPLFLSMVRNRVYHLFHRMPYNSLIISDKRPPILRGTL